MKNFVANFENVSGQIDVIVREMEDARLKLMKDISMMDVLYDKSKNYIKELDMYIIAGEVKIGELSFIGIGSSIVQSVNIGRNCVLGAGSVVVSDFKDNSLGYGVPAKIIKHIG